VITKTNAPTGGSGWTKHIPYNRYFDFIKSDADRYAVLLECIALLKLNSSVISIDDKRHIFIFPHGQKSLRSSGGIFPFKDSNPYLFSAHYDRVAGSPGANDNSIAVFHLLNAASLLAAKGIDRWIIVFTDKEELSPGEGFEEQGSYSLAKKLKSWGLEKARIYNFDTCGCGSTFLFSSTTDIILTNSVNPKTCEIRNTIRHLRDHALETANLLRLDQVLLAPTPFSDDVGFLRAGLAAQTVTILPEKEAGHYEALLRARPDFGDLIISGKVKDPSEYRNLPETWRSLNGAGDVPSLLTPEFFEGFVGFVVNLAS